jgi:hypothetical protein
MSEHRTPRPRAGRHGNRRGQVGGRQVVVDVASVPACGTQLGLANAPWVIGVAAVGRNGMKRSYSNFGHTVDIWAPTDVRATVTPYCAGTGLGLAVCKHLVTEFRGSIEVGDADGGRGARFRVVIPIVE